MAEYSGFHPTVGDGYQPSVLAEVYRHMSRDGYVAGFEQGLAVEETAPPTMGVRVRPGFGWVQGYWYYSDSDITLPVPDSHGTLDRIDRVVLRLNTVTGTLGWVIKEGAAAADPNPPTLTRDLSGQGIYEMSARQVPVPAGSNRVEGGAAGQASIEAESDTSLWSASWQPDHIEQHHPGGRDAFDTDLIPARAVTLSSRVHQSIVGDGNWQGLTLPDVRSGSDTTMRSGNNLKAPRDGWYRLSASVSLEPNQPGRYGVQLVHTAGGGLGFLGWNGVDGGILDDMFRNWATGDGPRLRLRCSATLYVGSGAIFAARVMGGLAGSKFRVREGAHISNVYLGA